MTIKIGINGFGRIGRMVFRTAVQNFKDDIEVVAINDLLEPDYLAYMLQYDSVHGRFEGEVAVEGATLVVNGKRIRLTAERDPAALKWGEAGAKAAATGSMKGVLAYTQDEVVASDFRGEVCTSVFDADAGIALDKTFVKVVAWYDNEWGYSNKVLEMVRVVGAPR